jgi:hypothetical protein
MADLTASDITVTVDPGFDIDTSPDKWKRAYATLSFGDGVLTYPTYGVPMPAPGAFGMNFKVPYKWVNIRQNIGATQWAYDETARTGAPYGTLRNYNTSTGAETSGALGATGLDIEVTGK